MVATGALFGNHARQTTLESDWHLVDCVQVSVMQHPPELELTCGHASACVFSSDKKTRERCSGLQGSCACDQNAEVATTSKIVMHH